MSEYDDNYLVRALRAPGTPSELAGEDAIVAAYRSEHRRRVGLARRLGLGGTTVVLVVGLSGGVAAAAWTNLLPDAIQQAAHGAFGGIGVPQPTAPDPDVDAAPEPQLSGALPANRAEPAAPGAAVAPSTDPKPSEATSAEPDPQPTQAPASPLGSSLSTSPANPVATTPGSPAQGPAAQPGALTAAASSAKVAEGGSVTVSGLVTDTSGAAMPRRAVALALRTAGGSWRLVAHGRTDAAGAVTLPSPALATTSTVRLVTGTVLSDSIRIGVRPPLSASWSSGGITVRSSATWTGEQVRLKVGKRVVGTAWLDASGTAVVAIDQRQVPMRVRVGLSANAQHAAVRTSVVVPRSSDRAASQESSGQESLGQESLGMTTSSALSPASG